MYTRELSEIPKKLIKNGKAIFGTFEGCPERLDIKGIKSPFTEIPLPQIISNFRIKSSLSFMFSIGDYIGIVDFFDQKIFGFAEVTFWNKVNKRKFSYRKLMGPRRRFIPHNMKSGFCASFKKNRYIRISWDRARNRFSMIFSLKGDSSRPSARAAFVAPFVEERMNEVLAVLPYPTKRRCSATYFSTPSIHGSLTLGKTKLSEPILMNDTDGFSILKVNRAYYTFEASEENVVASGLVDVNGTKKRVSIVITGTDDDQVDQERLNKNFLFVDGKKTPLPPVTITHTAGIKKNWVIQDFENMVDLTFTPIANHVRDMSAFVIHMKANTIYGKFEGALRTSEDEVINISNFEGIVRSQSIRS